MLRNYKQSHSPPTALQLGGLKKSKNMKLQLFINDAPILGSDGILNVDGRLNIYSVANIVRERNKRVQKNFPHNVCNGFARFKNDKISNSFETQYKL